MDLGLGGAKALVQGGTKGMGLAAAECFAADGANVAVLARMQADLDAAVGRLRDLGAPDALGLRAMSSTGRRSTRRWRRSAHVGVS